MSLEHLVHIYLSLKEAISLMFSVNINNNIK